MTKKINKPENLFYLHDENWVVLQEKIISIVENAVKGIKKIEKKFPECGIGDTITDESISEYFYEKLHWD